MIALYKQMKNYNLTEYYLLAFFPVQYQHLLCILWLARNITFKLLKGNNMEDMILHSIVKRVFNILASKEQPNVSNITLLNCIYGAILLC